MSQSVQVVKRALIGEPRLIAPLVRGFAAGVYLDGLPIDAGKQQAWPYQIAGHGRPQHPGRPRTDARAAHYRLLSGAAKGLSFGAGLSMLGARQLTLPNTLTVSGYVMLHAQGGYDFGRFTLPASVVNLARRRAFDSDQYFGGPLVMPVQPRSVFRVLKTAF